MNYFFKVILTLSVLLAVHTAASASSFRTIFKTDTQYLVVEILDDDLAHLEFSVSGKEPPTDQPLYTSPMVLKKDYSGLKNLQWL